jgi:hypothetical protein
MKNRDLLDILEREGDIHTIVHEVTHCVYFETDIHREQFLKAVIQLGYRQLQLFSGESLDPSDLRSAAIRR